MRIPLLSALALGALCTALPAQTPTPLNTIKVAGSVNKPLWVGQAPGDDTRLFVVQQKATPSIQIFKAGVKNALPFLDLTGKVNTTGNERGLLGLAFHPDYANNHFFYVDYTSNLAGSPTIIERYTALDADTADPNSGLPIFTSIADPQDNHNGGNIRFGPDGKLYLGLGDGGNFNDTGTGHVAGGNAQATNVMWGKMHRLNDDGSIPTDNPFFGDANYVQSIWDIGVRNPWRWSFDRETGDLWIGDVGQDAHEEIDFEPFASGGHNYGWRCMEGFSCTGLSGCVCNDAALTLPIHDYGHGGGKCSVTGGYVYRGPALPDWNGIYFFADYCTAQVWSLVYDGVTATVTERTAELAPGGGLSLNSITSFGEDNDGELYVCDQGGATGTGEIFKMVPEGPFTGLGHALAGVNGKPVLWGEGTLQTGSAGALNMRDIAPSAPGALFVSLSEGSASFKGGIVVAVPLVALVAVVSDANGELQLAWPSWPLVPSATTIVFQGAFMDAAAVKGVSLTNGLRALTP
ncbi:MAG TPA: PQQ-dependent sugar dehydrogenase [Planctomycetota bacterium]|nr:PQQ-dependent sugar dehydrogenase [Planctomycetota bacterium]